MCRCPQAIDGGVATGSGGGPSNPSVLWVLPADVDVATVFPVVDPVIDVAIPAAYLAVSGDTLIGDFTGFVINNSGGAQPVNFFAAVSPTAGVVDPNPAWGGLTINIPPDNLVYPWKARVVFARRLVGTYTATGSFEITDFSSALFGRGDFTQPNQGGPASAVAADPACNWANAQRFRIQGSLIAAGITFRFKSGVISRYSVP